MKGLKWKKSESGEKWKMTGKRGGCGDDRQSCDGSGKGDPVSFLCSFFRFSDAREKRDPSIRLPAHVMPLQTTAAPAFVLLGVVSEIISLFVLIAFFELAITGSQEFHGATLIPLLEADHGTEDDDGEDEDEEECEERPSRGLEPLILVVREVRRRRRSLLHDFGDQFVPETHIFRTPEVAHQERLLVRPEPQVRVLQFGVGTEVTGSVHVGVDEGVDAAGKGGGDHVRRGVQVLGKVLSGQDVRSVVQMGNTV